METSLTYEIFDHYQNVVVSGSDDVTFQKNPFSCSTSYATPLISRSIAEKRSHWTEYLSYLRARGGSGEEPPRKRRRRARNEKKIEEKEKQRMNHIAVERNRRRQMNHFLSILKSMMPPSYSQRSDQASIIEGTINYLKKQERLLQSLEAQLKATDPNQTPNIFSDFFIFLQFSTATASADVEVTMVERHANIKVFTKTRPKLIFNIIKKFHSLGLSTLHLNLTTSKDMSLFTFSVKVEEDCQLTATGSEVASAVHEVVRRIHKENCI
ncbi:hypothetical protein EUTSA_v10004772mg [Eutrema salsugineum]|uniref:BHLH domain-containing protein n=1 Tax=Eutrema salsugineum TaxID=72664 RepID=V4KVD2_EUTSA|nr:transcription factor bHLH99 [Eutrema salsugineum]ESQ31333.1 hypothetical protein EUTSA_v10004772mg [Eutrema salsugineum]